MKKIIRILSVSAFFIAVFAVGKIYAQQEPQISTGEVQTDTQTQAVAPVVTMPLQSKELSGYYVQNSVKLAKDVNFFIADSTKTFYSVLTRSKKGSLISAEPNFKDKFAVVIALRPSVSLNAIKINGISVAGTDVYVDYEVISKGDSGVGYFVSNSKVLEIAKPNPITNVIFISSGVISSTMPFGKRGANSPVSVADLTTNFTGTFSGSIPSASGSGVFITLTLNPDFTYSMKQTYTASSDKAFESSGNWMPSADLSYFTLDYDKDVSSQVMFYFTDKNTIEKLDVNGEKIVSDNNYKLKR